MTFLAKTAAAAAFLALSTAQAADLFDVSGEAIPRAVDTVCATAAAQLKSKLVSNGFEQVEASCVGTNDDVGSRLPVVKAKSPARPYKVTTNQSARSYDDPNCTTELSSVKAGIPDSEILELECLKGVEAYTGKTFYQAWLTRLVALEAAAQPKTETPSVNDGKEPKLVPARILTAPTRNKALIQNQEVFR